MHLKVQNPLQVYLDLDKMGPEIQTTNFEVSSTHHIYSSLDLRDFDLRGNMELLDSLEMSLKKIAY